MDLTKINIKYRSIKDMIYEELKNAVITGALEPDELLSEEYLSEKLNVGRTPLREATQLLVYSGWFIKEKGRLKVSPIKESDIINLFLIRERLEGLSAFQTTYNITEYFINSLKKNLNEMEEYEKQGNTNGVLESGKKFHNLIIKQSGNNVLERMISPVLDQITRYRHLGITSVSGRSESAVKEHRKILDSLKCGDAKQAEYVVRKHIISSKNSIILSTNN